MSAAVKTKILPALIGAGTTLAAAYGLTYLSKAKPRVNNLFSRVNFHGRSVSLRGGVAVCISTACVVALTNAARVRAKSGYSASLGAATLAASAAGVIDDLDQGIHDGGTPAKGLKGHLKALAQGQITTGLLKIVIIGSGAAITSVYLTINNSEKSYANKILDAALRTVIIASWANLHNLLDLRPGRALKFSLLFALPMMFTTCSVTNSLAAGALGIQIVALPSDLKEITMLGDSGANALGALVGTAIAAHPNRIFRFVMAGVGAGLVLASEKVSFSQVIAGNSQLAFIDALGREQL